MGHNVSLRGIVFLFVIIMPYLGGMWALLNMYFHLSVQILSWTLIFLSAGGVCLICDALFIHPDPQSSWIFVALPVFLFPVMLMPVLPPILFKEETGSRLVCLHYFRLRLHLFKTAYCFIAEGADTPSTPYHRTSQNTHQAGFLHGVLWGGQN